MNIMLHMMLKKNIKINTLNFKNIQHFLFNDFIELVALTIHFQLYFNVNLIHELMHRLLTDKLK